MLINNSKASHRYEAPRLSYKDIKHILKHRLAQQKRGLLIKYEISHIVKEWKDQRVKEELDKAAIKREIKRLEQTFKK